MKKYLALILSFVLATVLFAGCGDSGGSQSAPAVQSSSEAASPAKPAESSPAQSDAPAATDYPTGTIEIITAGSPGGDADLFPRTAAKYLEAKWGVPVVVTNISGQPAAINQVHDAKPDGYTLMSNHDAFLINSVTGMVDFGFEEMTLLGIYGLLDGQVLVSRSELGWETLDDLRDACAAEPDTYNVGIAYTATTRVMGEMLMKAGVECRLVDSDGGSDRIAKLLGGHMDAAFLTWQHAEEYITSGQWNALCIVQEERSKVCPDIPTALEQGYDVIYPTRHFLALPAGADPAIVAVWDEALKELNENPDYVAEIESIIPGGYATYVSATDAMPIMDEVRGYIQEYLG